MNESMLRTRLTLQESYHATVEEAKDKLIAGYIQLLDAMAVTNSHTPSP